MLLYFEHDYCFLRLNDTTPDEQLQPNLSLERNLPGDHYLDERSEWKGAIGAQV